MTQEEEKQIKEYYRLNKTEIVPSKVIDRRDLWIAKTLKKHVSMGWSEESPWRHNAVRALEDWGEKL